MLHRAVTALSVTRRSRTPASLLTTLLEGLFFQAHVTESRIIGAAQLEAAVQQLERLKKTGPAIAAQAQRLLMDNVRSGQLPLLTVLQEEPFQMQATHAAFQDFYAARAICHGHNLSSTPPWKWHEWWNHCLRFGSEMGDTFRQGLLAGAGMEARPLNLSAKIGGHRPTAMRAVEQLMLACATVDLSNNELTNDELAGVARALKQTTTLVTLTLHDNHVSTDAARALATAMPTCTSLQKLK